jgi:Ca2+-binding EF-hand superfamily protein
VARILKRFPEADKDKDGKLSTEEFKNRFGYLVQA